MSTSGSKSNEHVAHFLVDIHILKVKVVIGIYLKSMVLNLTNKFADGLKIIRSLGTPG